MRNLVLGSVCSGLLTVAMVASAQHSPVQSDVIRTTTSLVEVAVVAVDAHGKPVLDLRREEFEILDNNRTQPLTLFVPCRSEIAEPPAGSAPAPGDARPAQQGYAVFLTDWLNTTGSRRVIVQESLLRLLKNFEPRQKVAIYVLSPYSHLLVDFTADRDILTTLVERMGLNSGPDDLGPRIWTLELRIKETARVINLVADRLLHVPGRKSLIWLTEGFSGGRGAAPQALFFQAVEKNLAKLNTADVAVYTIDAGGLRIVPNRGLDAMWEISNRTGGTFFSDRNDLDEGMRLALEDGGFAYTLGFHAPADARAELHAIKVRVDRPGVKLRYRESYDPKVSIH